MLTLWVFHVLSLLFIKTQLHTHKESAFSWILIKSFKVLLEIQFLRHVEDNTSASSLSRTIS